MGKVEGYAGTGSSVYWLADKREREKEECMCYLTSFIAVDCVDYYTRDRVGYH